MNNRPAPGVLDPSLATEYKVVYNILSLIVLIKLHVLFVMVIGLCGVQFKGVIRQVISNQLSLSDGHFEIMERITPNLYDTKS